MMSSLSKNKQMLMIYLFLMIATLVAFWRVNSCDFLYFDDPFYVTENDHVQNGITLEGIRWAFTTGHVANWHPLTWISHMLDVQLFGLQPRWHHVTNLLFHLANTLLLFFVLQQMTKARWESAFVAALFALHPLHVESVAWVSERKDVLSTFFWILTMGAYYWYVERPALQRYLLVVLFFALGLMSKPMLVTLPFVLLLLDYWPLQRFQQMPSDQKTRTKSGDRQTGKSGKAHAAGETMKAETPANSGYQWASIRPLLREKIPLFVLTLLSSIVTYSVQQKGGMVVSSEALPLGTRISNAFVSYVTYIVKTFWPGDLAVLYPLRESLPIWQVFGAVLFLMMVTLTVIRKAREAPYLAMGWLWFAGTLVPVIGIVQVGMQARADRYTYVPLIGLFIMVAWGMSKLSSHWRYRKEILIALSTAVLLGLCVVTWTQVRYWQDTITLFGHDLGVTDNNAVAYYNRGHAYATLGSDRQAIADYDNALKIRPNYEEAHLNRGTARAHLGDYRQALGDFDKALEIRPNYAEAYYNRGAAYLHLNNYQQAVGDYSKAIESNPNYAEAYYNRAFAFWRLGNAEQAIAEDLRTAARLGHKGARNTLRGKGMGW